MEGSLSEVVTPPPHNLDIPHILVDGYTQIQLMYRYKTVQGFKDSGKEQEFLATENRFSNNGEVIYTRYKQRGKHYIHYPIHSDIYPKDETGIFVMETESIIYINFYHFYSILHSPTMEYRHGH